MAAKPGGGLTDLGALRRVNSAAWARAVRRAMRSAAGHVPHAAKALGVSTRTLYGWLQDPALADVQRAPIGVHRSR